MISQMYHRAKHFLGESLNKGKMHLHRIAETTAKVFEHGRTLLHHIEKIPVVGKAVSHHVGMLGEKEIGGVKVHDILGGVEQTAKTVHHILS